MFLIKKEKRRAKIGAEQEDLRSENYKQTLISFLTSPTIFFEKVEQVYLIVHECFHPRRFHLKENNNTSVD